MSLMDWLRRQLDADERDANTVLADNERARTEGLTSTLWDEQDADARQALRLIAVLRAILDLHEPAVAECRTCAGPSIWGGEHEAYPCATVKLVAAIYAEAIGGEQ